MDDPRSSHRANTFRNVDHHESDALCFDSMLDWCISTSTYRCRSPVLHLSEERVRWIYICVGRYELTTLLTRKILSVKKKHAILIFLLVTHYRLYSLSDPNPDPTLILNLCRGVRDNLSFSKEKRTGRKKTCQTTFPNVHRSSLGSLSASGVFFTSPSVA